MSKTIALTQGFSAKVSDEDFERLSNFKWFAHLAPGHGPYAIGRVNGPHVRMHRFIMNAQPGESVDHIDGDTLNNQRENLRLCTNSQNIANSKKPKTNTSGYKGVGIRSYGFEARIKFHQKSYHIGTYKTATEAHEAYCAKAKELFGEFARFE